MLDMSIFHLLQVVTSSREDSTIPGLLSSNLRLRGQGKSKEGYLADADEANHPMNDLLSEGEKERKKIQIF